MRPLRVHRIIAPHESGVHRAVARRARRLARPGSLQERARARRPAGRRWCTPASARSSTCAPTTTSGSPTIRRCAPRRSARSTEYGYGMASVRFICGTQQTHKTLEQRLARFLGTEDAILYSSCFDANGGLFETLLDERDAVISDALNHASIIDGIRLCKAQRYRYANSDMAELENVPASRPQGARTRLIATDGVFSMDGFIAKLREICDLAERYDALVMVDDSHATGFMGAERARHARALRRRASASTSSPARSARRSAAPAAATSPRGARSSSGCGSARGPTCSPTASRRWSPRRASRCSICSSNSASCARSCSRTRASSAPGSTRAGFDLKPGEHPIIPVMLGDAALAGRMADALLDAGRVRHRLLLPGGAEGPGAHPHADVRGADARAARAGARGIHARRARARRDSLTRRAPSKSPALP